jgi:hypothetical protein
MIAYGSGWVIRPDLWHLFGIPAWDRVEAVAKCGVLLPHLAGMIDEYVQQGTCSRLVIALIPGAPVGQ